MEMVTNFVHTAISSQIRSCALAAALLLPLLGCGVQPPAPEGWLGESPAWFAPAQESGYGAAGPAAPDLSKAVSLDALMALAFERNPSLQAARDRYRAAVASHGEAVGLPDPTLQWTTRPDPVETRTGPQTDVYSAALKIPYPGKLILKGQIATDEARIARQAFLLATRDLVAELKQAYFELAYLDQATEIVRRTQDLAQHLASAARSGVAENAEVRSDQVTLFDALKAEAQLSQLSYDLATLLELRATEEARLNRILNLPPGAPVGTPRPIALRQLRLTRKELYDLTVRNRQELEIARARLEQAGRLKDLADLSWAPDFFVGGSLMATGSPIMDTPDAGQDAWGISLGITLPLWGGKNQSRVAQAEHRRRAAIRERQEAFNRALEHVTRLFFRLSRELRLVVLYRDQLMPQARAAMETAEQWQAIGRDDFGRVLEAQGVWLNFTLALARAATDYQQTLAQMEQAVGIPLAALLLEQKPSKAKERDE